MDEPIYPPDTQLFHGGCQVPNPNSPARRLAAKREGLKLHGEGAIKINAIGDLYVCGRLIAVSDEERAEIAALCERGPACRWCGAPLGSPLVCCDAMGAWVTHRTLPPDRQGESPVAG